MGENSTCRTVVQIVAAGAVSTTGWPLLVAGCIQNDQCENVNVPHAVDAGEECWREFKVEWIVQTVLAFRHLPDDEAGDGERSAKECGQHEKLESIDDALVVQTSSHWHGWQWWSLDADVTKHTPNHVAQKEEVNASGHTGEQNERELKRKKMIENTLHGRMGAWHLPQYSPQV